MTRSKNRRLGVLVVVAVIPSMALAACGTDSEIGGSGVSAVQKMSDESGEPGPDSGSGSRESGEHAGSESGQGEESATEYRLDDTHDEVRAGARLILTYDVAANAFSGTVENTTTGVLSRVRVEVHLSNGVELGPTAPTDLSAGQVIDVTLPATDTGFESWSAHSEVGGGSEPGDGESESGEHSDSQSGEHGSEGGEHGGSEGD